ncbi:sugar phosphorylase [Aliifodinibius sp. S!AR15-10]|uniref:sugar phosphorylase n=1 Tax=Aliifodinibius sp. S!AR15-10 TaxID=2950437 RepID=UPI002863D2A2|nr:sugar phosphorylase [Aliifodinibius sp. S!AR15-10]MDR8390308.1 sugar phosphorylase [Aliifodinibius sp. S!AR15-10]
MADIAPKVTNQLELHTEFTEHFQKIYGPGKVDICIARLEKLIGKYAPDIPIPGGEEEKWTEKDSILITYGDVLRDLNRPAECRLDILEEFLEHYVKESVSAIHILPFFPSSSDAGFSVIDYKKVREDLGSWDNIKALSQDYRIMADMVINHTSRYSNWFQNFKEKKEPGKNYFIDVDPNLDISQVTRPRNSPLLTPVQTDNGNRCVWTTFSADQVDVDFSNPDVLFEYLDIFLFYLSQGIQIVRLDAIAYLWKKIGTNCIHLPETHEVVKLFRTLVDEVAPHVTLVTETNVPHEENISYFGDGDDEAHMVYQFSLPPLLLHAILTENTQYLTDWASRLEGVPKGCYFMNFTASHDGIGVRPLEGLVPEEEFEHMIDAVYEREGFVSYKKNKDGSESPYELNITYFDAFSDPGSGDDRMQIKRYLCSQAIMLSLKGVPGIYFHNLTATKNNTDEAIATDQKRTINRMQWEFEELVEKLEDETTTTHYVMNKFEQMLDIRGEHPAFHPDAPQEIFNCGNDLFVIKRTALDESETIFSISNATGKQLSVDRDELPLPASPESVTDLLSGDTKGRSGSISLEPFETVWLCY